MSTQKRCACERCCKRANCVFLWRVLRVSQPRAYELHGNRLRNGTRPAMLPTLDLATAAFCEVSRYLYFAARRRSRRPASPSMPPTYVHSLPFPAQMRREARLHAEEGGGAGRNVAMVRGRRWPHRKGEVHVTTVMYGNAHNPPLPLGLAHPRCGMPDVYSFTLPMLGARIARKAAYANSLPLRSSSCLTPRGLPCCCAVHSFTWTSSSH